LHSNRPDYQLDPVYVNSLREAKVVLFVFVIFAVYTLSVCYLCGWSDSDDAESVATVLGIPSWVFWGIVLPWGAANIVTAWFCFSFMTDDDLEPGETESVTIENPEFEMPSNVVSSDVVPSDAAKAGDHD